MIINLFTRPIRIWLDFLLFLFSLEITDFLANVTCYHSEVLILSGPHWDTGACQSWLRQLCQSITGGGIVFSSDILATYNFNVKHLHLPPLHSQFQLIIINIFLSHLFKFVDQKNSCWGFLCSYIFILP